MIFVVAADDQPGLFVFALPDRSPSCVAARHASPVCRRPTNAGESWSLSVTAEPWSRRIAGPLGERPIAVVRIAQEIPIERERVAVELVALGLLPARDAAAAWAPASRSSIVPSSPIVGQPSSLHVTGAKIRLAADDGGTARLAAECRGTPAHQPAGVSTRSACPSAWIAMIGPVGVRENRIVAGTLRTAPTANRCGRSSPCGRSSCRLRRSSGSSGRRCLNMCGPSAHTPPVPPQISFNSPSSLPVVEVEHLLADVAVAAADVPDVVHRCRRRRRTATDRCPRDRADAAPTTARPDRSPSRRNCRRPRRSSSPGRTCRRGSAASARRCRRRPASSRAAIGSAA